MKTVSNRPLLSLLFLSLCLLFLGINGLLGGYTMLSNSTGDAFGMPLSVLERTPFQNWFVPGLVLLLLWGLGSFVVLTSLWTRPRLSLLSWLSNLTHEHWAWASSILLGLALLVWLTVQVFTLPAIAPIQVFLYGLALVLIIVPLLPGMRQYYSQSERE